MEESKKFPLLSGNPSIDLVNTEVVRRGNRHDLLITDEDVHDWLDAVAGGIPFWREKELLGLQDDISNVRSRLLEVRGVLREQFESIADHGYIADECIAYLEKQIEQAPVAYKLIGRQLIAVPIGSMADGLAALIALDALTLIAEGKLISLRRCSNEDCVLLFMDESGRRKWCSMKICGNRNKVAKFQHRKHGDEEGTRKS